MLIKQVKPPLASCITVLADPLTIPENVPAKAWGDNPRTRALAKHVTDMDGVPAS